MSQTGEKSGEALLQDAIKCVNQRNQQLIQFLQNGEPVKINNIQYMESYNLVLKTSDSGADPCDTNADKKRVNLNLEERLFKHYVKIITEYLEKDYSKVKDIHDDEEFVDTIKNQFSCFKIYEHWMWKVFQYLDRFYLKNLNSSLKKEAFKIYKTDYWEKLSEKIFKVVVRFQFDQLRNDCIVPKQTLQTLIQVYSFIGFVKSFDFTKTEDMEKFNLRIKDEKDMYIMVDFEETKSYYETNFQQQFAVELENHYKKKVMNWKNLSTPEYVTEVLKALESEKQIAEYYYPNSKDQMIQIIEQITIIEPAHDISFNEATGVFYMLQNEKESQLTDIFNLFNHSTKVRDTLKNIATKFQEYLVLHGRSYQQEAEQAKNDKKSQKDIALEYIRQVQSLRKKSEHLMSKVFNNDLILQSARDKSFQTFLNEYERATFYLAMHSDNLLKSEQFNNEQEVEEELNNILKIFFSLFARDAFFKHYQKFFSNRLLNSTSKNFNAEKDLISKFKSEAGQTAVSKIVTMLQDINQSTEMMSENTSQLKQIAGYDMAVNVLTSGCWPLQVPQQNEQSQQQQIPKLIKIATEGFSSLYLKKHAGRNLQWMYSQGTSEIMFKAKDDKDKAKACRYTIISNSYQLLLLLSLDETPKGTIQFSQLLQNTGIPQEELDFNLQPLFKLKILSREKKDGPVGNSESVTINENFSNKQRKVKCIPGGKADRSKQDKEAAANQEKWQKEIESERECVVDACIVRIMKGKRQLMFNQLIPECITMITNFKAEIPVIKRRIESLIDRDYLKRETNDINKLVYVP